MKKKESTLALLLGEESLQNLINHFAVATSLPVRCFDRDGTLLYLSEGGSMCFRAMIQASDAGLRACEQQIRSAAEKSQKLGEACLFTCHAGLVGCAAPLLYGEELLGCVILGPVILWSKEEEFVAEVEQKAAPFAIRPELVDEALEDIPEISCEKMRAAADLLTLLVSQLVEGQIQISVRNRALSRQQAQIAELVLSKKRAEAALDETPALKRRYPIDKERDLIGCVQLKDTVNAKRILNELLGEIFFGNAGNNDFIKARLVELIAVLSRAAVDAGAPFELLADRTAAFARELEACPDFETMCRIVTETLDEFMTTVYDAGKTASSQYLASAIAYIRKHYAENLTLEQVAQSAFVSPYYLSHLFRAELDLTFSEYVLRFRINMAKKMMKEGNEKVQTIAEKVGFLDPNYFSKQFKRLVGVSPKKFRGRT